MDILKIPYLFDVIFALILILMIRLGRKKGAFRIVAGMCGTLVAWVGAGIMSPNFTPLTASLVEPYARRAVERAARSMGETLLSQAGETVAVGRSGAMPQALQQLGLSERLHELAQKLSVQQAFVKLLEGAEGQVSPIELMTKAVVDKIAPILTFFVLFFLIKLAINLIARFLSLDWPIVGALNRLSGGLFGALGGVLLVLALCAGILRYGSDEPAGLTSKQMLSESYVGGFVCQLVGWSPESSARS